jgi:transcriptional regulator with XRE-family HTH domain
VSQHTNNSLSANFSTALATARGNRTQAEFARYLGIPSQQTYQRYENGLIPSGKVLHQISRKLGVTVDSLLVGQPAENVSQTAPGSRSELDVDKEIQLTTALTIVWQHASAAQLREIVKDLITNKALTDKAKVFWVSLVAPWIKAKEQVSAGAQQSSTQRVSAHRAKVYRQRAPEDAAKHTA